jgi:hypothetical protein
LGTLGGPAGRFLPDNISEVTVSPTGNNFFYLAPLANDIAGTVTLFRDGRKSQVFTSSFTEWLPQWVGESTIFMTTKPSWRVAGNTYALNAQNGSMVKVFGGIQGLTTLVNNSGTLALYNGVVSNVVTTGIYDINQKTFTPLGIQTISDKCIWSVDNVNIYCGVPQNISTNEIPDEWYKGIISFSDSIVKINTIGGEATLVSDISNIDAMNLKLSQNENELFFINKKDSTLWSLNLE